MMNIYVGNLPYSVKDDELREAFEAYGDVASAEVIFDRRTKRSRGYGFVEMESEDAARRAIDALNGADFQGRELRVDESQPKEQKARRTNGDGQARPAQRAEAPAETPRSNGAESGGGFKGFLRKLFG